MKALRHEAPGIAATAKRLGVKASGDAVGLRAQDLPHHPWRQAVGRAGAGRADRRRRHLEFARPRRRAGSPASSKMMGQLTEKRGPATAGETVAFGKLDHARTGDTLSSGKQRARRGRHGEALSGRARHRDLRQGAQGRRQARPRSQQAGGGRPLAHRCSTIRRLTKWWCGARARCICGSPPSGSPTVSASPSSGAGRPSATARPSRSRSCSAAATRSNRAATASSATSCSTSSRCRAAPASCSRRRSPAAWCRATTSPRSRKA